MDIQDFYKQFSDVDAALSKLTDEHRLKREEVDSLEKRIDHQQFIHQVIAGLTSTPQQQDPGKYETAYYFVKEITPTNILQADVPTLYHICPNCNTQQPVIMSYEQKGDVMGGDWVKNAFILCQDETTILDTKTNINRF